nr:PREDICTED: ankyrin repeat and SOCS box protein 9-like isoform X3 [Paralichthys olivaceus]
MSAGHKETPRDTTCQTGTVVFSSNPLMSDVESDWSPIHDAAFNGRVLTLQKLITQGICVNLNTLDRVSPLHGACVQGHEACVKLLMENGADVNGSTVDGKTPLTEACARGHMTCVSLLLQHGATPVGTSHSSSPIHRAAAKGAGVNNSVSGDSPLHIAARLSHPELVSLLLDHGADRSLRNPEGQRPLDLAPPNSLAERLLRQAGEVSPLMQMCRLNIRRAVGKRRLGGIHDLQLPTELKHYLLYH